MGIYEHAQRIKRIAKETGSNSVTSSQYQQAYREDQAAKKEAEYQASRATTETVGTKEYVVMAATNEAEKQQLNTVMEAVNKQRSQDQASEMIARRIIAHETYKAIEARRGKPTAQGQLSKTVNIVTPSGAFSTQIIDTTVAGARQKEIQNRIFAHELDKRREALNTFKEEHPIAYGYQKAEARAAEFSTKTKPGKAVFNFIKEENKKFEAAQNADLKAAKPLLSKIQYYNKYTKRKTTAYAQLKGATQFGQGVISGFYGGLEDQPLKTAATFGLSYGLTRAAPLLPKSWLKPLSVTGKAAAVGYGGVKTYQVATAPNARASGDVVGRALSTEVLPVAFGIKLGSKGLQKQIKANTQERSRSETLRLKKEKGYIDVSKEEAYIKVKLGKNEYRLKIEGGSQTSTNIDGGVNDVRHSFDYMAKGDTVKETFIHGREIGTFYKEEYIGTGKLIQANKPTTYYNKVTKVTDPARTGEMYLTKTNFKTGGDLTKYKGVQSMKLSVTEPKYTTELWRGTELRIIDAQPAKLGMFGSKKGSASLSITKPDSALTDYTGLQSLKGFYDPAATSTFNIAKPTAVTATAPLTSAKAVGVSLLTGSIVGLSSSAGLSSLALVGLSTKGVTAPASKTLMLPKALTGVKSGSIFKPAISTTPITSATTFTGSLPGTASVTKSGTGGITGTTPATPGTPTPTPITPPPLIPIYPDIFLGRGGGVGSYSPSINKRLKTPRQRYKSDITSATFNIRGKMPKVITGASARPIV